MKKMFYFYAISLFLYNPIYATLYSKIKSIYTLSVYALKPSINASKKIILERHEPVCLAGAFLAFNKFFIPKTAHEHIPVLPYIKTFSQYLIITWILHAYLVGDSFDKIQKELVDLNTSNRDIIQRMDSLEEKTNQIHELEKDTNKKVTLNEEKMNATSTIINKIRSVTESILQTIKDMYSDISSEIMGLNKNIQEIENNIDLKINIQADVINKNIKEVENNLAQKINTQTDIIISTINKK